VAAVVHCRAGSRKSTAIHEGGHAVIGESVALGYPSLWSAREGRDGDQHDAYCIAAWLSRADQNGRWPHS
jgi:hypothetical protein